MLTLTVERNKSDKEIKEYLHSHLIDTDAVIIFGVIKRYFERNPDSGEISLSYFIQDRF